MILSFVNEKGGVGKSTIAVNLAIRCSYAGLDVLLVDADPQQSASMFFQVRNDPESEGNLKNTAEGTVTCISKIGNIQNDVKLMSDKYDVTIIDTGGRDSIEARTSMMVANAIIIPAVASQFDSWSLEKILKLYREAKMFNSNLMAFILPNKISPNPMIKEGAELLEFLREEVTESDEMYLLDSVVFERIAFRKVIRSGLSVFEIDDNGKENKAKLELDNLFNEIDKRLSK